MTYNPKEFELEKTTIWNYSNKYLSPSGYRKTSLVQDENKTNYDWNEVTLCNMLKMRYILEIQSQTRNQLYPIKYIK